MLLSATSRAGSLEDEAWPLLQSLDAALIRFQALEADSPDRGGLYCPACGTWHSRAGEAVWPLAYEADCSGSSERREQALALGRWLIARQEEDGSWKESDSGWKGTTTDQLHALALAYPLLRQNLDWKERREWLRSIRRAADFVCRVMDNEYAYINYCATSAVSLAEAGQLLHCRKYIRKARALARYCISKINADGLLEGEGENESGGKRGIDIGYNLEMSLWGLARYAQLCRDPEVWKAAVRSAQAHQWFMYPDGTVDASMGLRSSKWSVWGSATADGCTPLWALMSAEDLRFEDLAVQNIRKIRACLSKSGLLAPGPDYDHIRDTIPCLYHSFAKAKSLAMALHWIKENTTHGEMQARSDTVIHFPTLQTAIIRRDSFQGTVSTYGYKARKIDSKFMQRPTGGAMTLLWAEGFGLIQSASQTEYRRWEESFPWMPQILPLTPRIEQIIEDARYTNLYDFDASLTVGPEFTCMASGQLRDCKQKGCGTDYSIRYSFTKNSLLKEYRIRGGRVRITEPVIIDDEIREVSYDGRSICFVRDSMVLVLSSENAPIKIDSASILQYKHVYPALRCLPVTIDTQDTTAEVRVIFTLLPRANPQKKVAVIAHRGFWKCEEAGYAQNSLAALKVAQDHGFWGSEFDVHLTRDNVVIVNHDDTIQGLRIADHPYSAFSTQRLPNGEHLPTLDEFLLQGEQYRTTRLVIELKPQYSQLREDVLWEETETALRRHALFDPERVAFISFSHHLCRTAAARAPGFTVLYLRDDAAPDQLLSEGISGIIFSQKSFNNNPDKIRSAIRDGLSVNAWISDCDYTLPLLIQSGIQALATNDPMKIREMLGEWEQKL